MYTHYVLVYVNANVATTQPKLNPNQLTAPGSGRSKVRLSPGHSMLDWIRLG